MPKKHLRQKKEYAYQKQLLDGYQNRFIRQCMIQKGVSGKPRVRLTPNLIGLLYKVNRCRKQLHLKEIDVSNVDEFLPNRPAPSGLIRALLEDTLPEPLRRKLTSPPSRRNESLSFWQYEKRLLHQWKQNQQ